MWKGLENKLKSFAPISLTELNADAAFLDRVDVKYIMSETEFDKVLEELVENFFILKINGKSIFEYSSIYMDSENYDFYFEHQNKLKPRSKIRTRKYLDSNIAFFEYKQKAEKVTRKFRFQFQNPEEHGKLWEEAMRFYSETYTSLYEKEAPSITPTVETKYNRITFCSKKNDERVTVDFWVVIKDLRNTEKKEIKLNNLVILESKSSGKNGTSYKTMEKLWIRRSPSCSKYALWLAYLWNVTEYSTFEKTMHQIDKIGNK